MATAHPFGAKMVHEQPGIFEGVMVGPRAHRQRMRMFGGDVATDAFGKRVNGWVHVSSVYPFVSVAVAFRKRFQAHFRGSD
jgi:hypothetical protein